ncbi:MAG: DUF5681 domain-containing protein [Terracidiphilus sp.]
MSDDRETENYEVGYGKPPESGKFKKGTSGNPSGRPKKLKDFGSQLLRELDSKLIINENGKRKVITKLEGVVKQLLNKSLSGHHPSTRLLIPLYLQGLEKAAEQQRPVYRTADDLTDDQLAAIATGGLKMRLYKVSTPDGADGR